MRQCPKCKSINPSVRVECYTHFAVQCKHIIGQKHGLSKFFEKYAYCNSINEFDTDDKWIYIKDVDGKKNKRPEFKMLLKLI